MGYAVSHGARRILLCGWSMGGAIVLQALDRSPLSDYVVGVALDSRSSTGASCCVTTGACTRCPARWSAWPPT